MANGLLPLVARIPMECGMRSVLLAICDLARQREDGRMVAYAPDKSIAIMLGMPERTVRYWKLQLREQGWISRNGKTKSEWCVTLPSPRAINDAMRQRWADAGEEMGRAPVIPDGWQVTELARPRPIYPATHCRVDGNEPGNPLPPKPISTRHTATRGRQPIAGYEKPSNYRFTSNQSNASVGPTSSAVTTANASGMPTVRGRLARKGPPDASQQDDASDSMTPDTRGMMG